MLQFLLKIPYKDLHIVIKNETGTAYYGTFYCAIKGGKPSMNFSLRTISNFKNLFLRKKFQYVVETKNEKLLKFIRENNSIKTLSEISKQTTFEPNINGASKKNHFELSTNYHLQFDDWTQVLEPLITFYKDFIDAFEDKYTSNYS